MTAATIFFIAVSVSGIACFVLGAVVVLIMSDAMSIHDDIHGGGA